MYIKNTQVPVKIQEGLKQTFFNKFSNSISKHEVVRMKNEEIFTDRDVEISKFLFKFKFATLEQIYTYLKLKNFLTQKNGEDQKETTIISIRTRLNKLVKNRILNKFALSVVEENSIPEDALTIYCLDLGGKFLLSNYSNVDTTDWYTSVNLKDSLHISKDLFTTEFYLKLLNTIPDKLLHFETTPLRKSEKINMIPNFDFGINHFGQKKYFIGEVVREADLPIALGKKMVKLERLINTNAWKKYYFDTETPPILLLLSENDLIALDSGRIVQGAAIDRFRLTTYERMMDELSKAFLAYVPDVNKLKVVNSFVFEK